MTNVRRSRRPQGICRQIDINLQKLLLFSKEIFKNKKKKIKNIFRSDLMDKKLKKLIDKRAEDLKTNELLYLFNEF